MEAATLASNGHTQTEDLPFSLPLELNVTDREVIDELWRRTEGRERDEYALAALRLGVLALKQARGQVDGHALKREGERLFADVAKALATHQSHLDSTLANTLRDYFDPTNGRFNERIDRLLKKDGELELLLARKITSENSEMSTALSRQIGQGSPLFRLLSPNESEGLLATLRKSVNDELEQQRKRVLAEFSLDNEQGALRRLCAQLQNSNGELKTDLKGQIDGLLKQFSFDDEQSALSRMAKTVNKTSEAITRDLTLDNENSALSRLQRELLKLLKDHREDAHKFQEDVRATLAGMQARREEAAASTRHGLDFESQVFEVAQAECQKLKDVATFVAKTPGKISRCLVGDVLVELSAESNAPASNVVIEAKEEQGYSLKQALKELDTARQNRDADAGLFVFSRKVAPPNLEPLGRYGCDVVVVWDADDSASDVVLKLGLSVARALCITKSVQREHQAADFTEIDKAILEINKQIEALDEIRTWTETIRNNGEKILDRLRKSREKLSAQVQSLTERIADLKQAPAAP
jgi:hypothetical protein